MTKAINLILFLSFIMTSLVHAQKINTTQSKVTFSIGNLGGINTVKGTFTGMTGTINFYPTELSKSKFDVCINAASINTGNAKRDKHLKNKDFFEVKKYKTICFKSTSIKRSGKKYIAKGKMTIHGVTKNVEIPFIYRKGSFEGIIKINRFDYGVGKGTNTFMVSKNTKIKITCVVK